MTSQLKHCTAATPPCTLQRLVDMPPRRLNGARAACCKYALLLEAGAWPVPGNDEVLHLRALSLPVVYRVHSSQDMLAEGAIFWERAVGPVVRSRCFYSFTLVLLRHVQNRASPPANEPTVLWRDLGLLLAQMFEHFVTPTGDIAQRRSVSADDIDHWRDIAGIANEHSAVAYDQFSVHLFCSSAHTSSLVVRRRLLQTLWQWYHPRMIMLAKSPLCNYWHEGKHLAGKPTVLLCVTS